MTKEELFLKEYQELCAKHKIDIVSVPNWIHNRDGSFNLIINLSLRVTEIEE